MLRKRFLSFISALLLLPVIGAGCTKGPDAATQQASKRVELNVWGVLDDSDAYDAIFRDYRALHPNVSINYRRLRLEEYETELLNAMAEDRGPDVFLIHNTWVGKYQPKILPMPATTKVAVQFTEGTLKKEQVYRLVTEPTMSIRKFKATFPDAVALDAVRSINLATKADERKMEDRILAIPMSVDTLGMYVNKDLLNAAGVATVPTTWDKFQTAIPRLVKVDADGQLVQEGAALGTGFNVERSPDIISALMMQNGAQMVDDATGRISFPDVPATLRDQRQEPPSFQALGFYTDFANPTKEVYTWNAKQPNSLDAFVQGKTAFFFGYSYHLPIIRARAPKLNLAISTLPQIDGNPTQNFANYWLWTVSKRTKYGDVSWNLLNFMMKPEEAKKYLDKAKRPAADKSLLTPQLEDEDVGVFASQVLTSKSWYRGSDPKAMEDAFEEMAENVVNGAEDIPTAIKNAAQKVEQTFR